MVALWGLPRVQGEREVAGQQVPAAASWCRWPLGPESPVDTVLCPGMDSVLDPTCLTVLPRLWVRWGCPAHAQLCTHLGQRGAGLGEAVRREGCQCPPCGQVLVRADRPAPLHRLWHAGPPAPGRSALARAQHCSLQKHLALSWQSPRLQRSCRDTGVDVLWLARPGACLWGCSAPCRVWKGWAGAGLELGSVHSSADLGASQMASGWSRPSSRRAQAALTSCRVLATSFSSLPVDYVGQLSVGLGAAPK